MNFRIAGGIAALAIAIAFLASRAEARTIHHDATYYFHDVTIGPNDVVEGTLNVVFGTATVEGTVEGDLNVIGGGCDVARGRVGGKLNCVESASLGTAAPWVAGYLGDMPFAEQTNRLFLMLAGNAIVLLVFLIFPVRVRLALSRVEAHPALCAVVGTIAFVAIVPVALLLILSLVGIPLVFLEALAVFAGIWIGQGAIAVLVGRRLAELVRPRTTPSPLFALLLGLVVVSAAEIVPYAGWIVTAITSLLGLGAAVLGFFKDGGVRFTRSTIGGPPMQTS